MKDTLISFGVAIVVGVIFVAILTLPFMLLWNWLIPDIFGLDKISFLEAAGVLILSNVIFKSNVSMKQK